MNYVIVAGASGFVTQQLPAAVGPGNTPPSFACYVLNPQDGLWYPVMEGSGLNISIGLSFVDGRWSVFATDVPPGASIAFVVVY